MTTANFIGNIEETYKKGVELIKAKNHDYAGTDDPFKNFRSAGVVGISPDRAILVRVLDKLVRVSNLLDSEQKVADEKIEDTILDVINYMAILKAMLDDKQSKI